MPNWVDNKLSIETDEETIKDIKYQVSNIGEHEGVEGYSIATNLYPLPHELKYVSGTGDNVEYFLLQDKIVRPPKVDENYFQIKNGEDPRWKTRPLTNGEKNKLIEEHGATNWYDWNILNYGTKWGDVDTELTVDHEDYLEFVFRSAWSPAIKLAEKISQEFKAKVVLKHYSFENMDEGKLVFTNGRCVEQVWKELNPDLRTVKAK